MSCPTDFIASVTTASSPMPTGPTTLHWPAASSSYPTQLRRAGRAITPKMVATTKRLAEAGYAGGFDAGEHYVDSSYSNFGEAVLDNLLAVGIRAKLRPLERAAFF